MFIPTDELASYRQQGHQRIRALRQAKTRWKHDLPAFCGDCLTIRPKTAKPQRFALNSVQRALDAELDNQRAETGMVHALILKARQMGISTYVGARFYHRMKYHGGHRTLIQTHRDDATGNLAGMVKRYHEHDPDPPPLAANNARELVFQNESGVTVGTAGTVVTEGGRSFTFQLAHLSELAFWNSAQSHLTAVLPTFPDVEGSEVIIESTAQGSSGPFHAMAMEARKGEGQYRLLFYPWFQLDEYAMAPPADWLPPKEWAELGLLHGLSLAQLRWAYVTNAKFALTDGGSPDEISWRFRQEYPSTIDEAFRAGRKGGYIAASTAAAARKRTNPHQGDMPLLIGCDFATGGGGGDHEHPDARDDDAQGSEDGDANVFISRRGRNLGNELYDRFRDRNTLSVANRLAAVIDRLRPARVFLDKGGGGAAVYDILCARGYTALLELVDFGASARPVDERQYRNKRAEMHGDFREWLKDGAIPDEDLLESEITAAWVHSEDDRGLTLAPKKEIRKKLGLSPDGSDAAVTTFAAPVRVGTFQAAVGGAMR